MSRTATLVSIIALMIVAEEARFGFALGASPLRSACQALGGKRATATDPAPRCITRLCYWLGDCGHWAVPVRWWDRVKVGDAKSTTIFWLGEPDELHGDDYVWQCAKGASEMCKVTFRDGRVSEMKRSQN